MNRGKWLLAISCWLLAIFINSCKEDTGSSGANVLPKSDLISAYESDTTTLLTSMYLKDSVVTDYTVNSLLGSYNDPIFGVTKASLYTGVESPVGASVPPWADTGTVDSAVLVLPYYYPTDGSLSYYANLDPQTFIVDTLTSIIQPTHTGGNTVAYYSDTNVKYGASPIAIVQLTPPNPITSATGLFSIKLNKSFTNHIVASMKNHNPFYYPYFDSLVKGLYLTVSNPFQLPGQGGILYINLVSNLSSNINIYYHYNSTPATAYYVPFPVGQSAPYFSHFDHNYATAPFYSSHQAKPHDSVDGNNLVYIQAMGGVIGRINFPYLKNWSKMNPVVINKAEIDITVNTQDCPSPYAEPLNLYLLGTDASGNPYETADEQLGTYYGGAFNGFTNTYTFVITEYIQDVIGDIYGKSIDRGLYIIPGNGGITANRVVLYGAQNPQLSTSNTRMKLKIYYTPLKTEAKKR